jgi:protein SCO1/2
MSTGRPWRVPAHLAWAFLAFVSPLHAAEPADDHSEHRKAMEKPPAYTRAVERYELPDVTLVDQDGERRRLRALVEGDQPVALNFIFTSCNAICPVMTATFARMRNELGADGATLRMISVSIDPEHDVPAVLQEYARRYQAGPQWRFLTGDSADITSILRAFDAYRGSKTNHLPLTLLRAPGRTEWVRITGLAGGTDLAGEVRLLRAQ